MKEPKDRFEEFEESMRLANALAFGLITLVAVGAIALLYILNMIYR